MRKKFIGILLAGILAVTSVFASCVPADETPGIAPSSLIPSSNNTYNLGRSNLLWKNLYIVSSGNATLSAGGTSVVVTHGMGVLPGTVVLTASNAIGTASSSTAANPVYATSINSTAFTATIAVASNQSATIYWFALPQHN